MSSIKLQYPHALPQAQAHTAARHIADALKARFGVSCDWQGDCGVFKRAGVDGTITLTPGEVQVTVKLGFPLSLMQGRIESEIRRVLQEKFQLGG